ncbi:MAG: TraM recognition domain-containing protein, partial [Chloroflexi bacterium]|nr:TraM recognition domain-containing protein [Chloroflexota bacterium]
MSCAPSAARTFCLLTCSGQSVYLRLSERDMRGLKPLLKLVWETLLNELVAHYDRTAGDGCHPVLLVLDEVARFAVPSLPEYAATVPGRGISLWVAVQSLSQLDGVYLRAGALALREALESHVFYRPSDLSTAEFLEQRLGEVSAYAHSVTVGQDGGRSSQGRSERACRCSSPRMCCSCRPNRWWSFTVTDRQLSSDG